MTNTNNSNDVNNQDLHLADYDLIIVNSSAGKDSQCALFEIVRQAKEQGYDLSKIHVSHQDLGRMEWEGTHQLMRRQSIALGISEDNIHVTRYRNRDGEELDLLDYVEKRQNWPSSSARFCTSEFKRSPGARVVTKLSKEGNVLYVFGFRAQESPARAKKSRLSVNNRISSKKRTVWEYNPILDWDVERVWSCIHDNGMEYHKAYDYGMPRLSCAFCIFAPKSALVIAGQHNPELLDECIAMEEKIGKTFRITLSLKEVKDALDQEVTEVEDWNM